MRDAHREFGSVVTDDPHQFNGAHFTRIHWKLLRCSGCGRAGLAKFHDSGRGDSAVLESFYPRALASSPLPSTVPDDIGNEYREAELCASAGAWRGASALVRSALEKTLKANGYNERSLFDSINAAASDTVITAARKQKAHEDIRVLGNEVVHDAWRAVSEEEVTNALHYTQRILEDLYDDRPTVEALLRTKNRLPSP
ncbi:MAG: DUF4145 domain-containing protein [Polyangiaceae bacterium]